MGRDLKVPYYEQLGEFDCSPTSVKMIAEYYKLQAEPIKFYKDLCRTTPTGTFTKDYIRALKILGLPMEKIHSTKEIIKTVREGHPVLVSFDTSKRESHTSVIVGYNSKKLYFILNDPYYGEGFILPQGILRMIQKDAYRLKKA